MYIIIHNFVVYIKNFRRSEKSYIFHIALLTFNKNQIYLAVFDILILYECQMVQKLLTAPVEKNISSLGFIVKPKLLLSLNIHLSELKILFAKI